MLPSLQGSLQLLSFRHSQTQSIGVVGLGVGLAFVGAAVGLAVVGAAYVGINSIRHSDEFFRYLGTIFSISNFNQSVLGCIEADFCDQICVGMKDPSALKMESP